MTLKSKNLAASRMRCQPCQVTRRKRLAAGQTLIPTLKQRLASPATLVSLAGADRDGWHLQERCRSIVHLVGPRPTPQWPQMAATRACQGWRPILVILLYAIAAQLVARWPITTRPLVTRLRLWDQVPPS